MINPPYSQKDKKFHELEFINHMLNCLKTGGMGIAIVPIPCAIKPHKIKEKLLAHHTLEAVMSMPDDLFYPVGVITCIMVFQAHIPHKQSNKKTWFGYWKTDGFTKSKHKGRGDFNNQWEQIRKRWVEQYRNKEIHAGEAITEYVTANDEWCAEAYMETDYSTLNKQMFIKKIKIFLSHLLIYHPETRNITANKFCSRDYPLDINKWKNFKYSDIFKIINGYYNRKPIDTGLYSDVPFIGATENNNGITSFASKDEIRATKKDGEFDESYSIGEKIYSPNCITVSNNGSVGNAFYQIRPFTCSHDINILYLKDRELNPYIAIFLCCIIELEKYRWNYGRKWRPMRMPKSIIKLPVDEYNNPDWKYMEEYIKSLPFSYSL